MASWGLAAVTWYIVAVGPSAAQVGWTKLRPVLWDLRNFFAGDQLSYLAITSNVINGLPALTEPLTATGTLYYPPAYFIGLGVVGRVFHLGPITSWNLVGLLVNFGLVVLAGTLAYRLIRRPWAPLLGLLPFLAGTLNTLLVGVWIRRQASHAVIAAPFTSLYALNGEVAGLAIGALGLTLIIRSILNDDEGLPRGRQAVIGYLLVGLTAAFHTYAFFASATVAAAIFCISWLRSRGTRKTSLVTSSLLVASWPLGLAVAAVVGPLAAFSVLAIPTLPAVRLAMQSGWRSLLPLGAAALAAAPQILHTLIGFARSDPFLTFRQDATSDLGISLIDAATSNLPLLLLILLVSLPYLGGDRRIRLGQTLGWSLGLTWVVLSFNQLWGFNQEPYRFSIELLLMATLLLPAFAVLRLTDRSTDRRSRAPRIVAAVMIPTMLLGLTDVVNFWDHTRDRGFINKNDRAALEQVDPVLSGELTLLDACMDALIFKVETGHRIVEYSPGVAWPEPKGLRDVVAARDQTELLLGTAVDSGVTRIVTHSDCKAGWADLLESAEGATKLLSTATDPQLTVWMVE